jgi:hypothetical protein
MLERRSGVGSERPTAEELLERGEIVVGSAATVREQLLRAVDTTGIGNLAVMFQAGTLPGAETTASLERFAEGVMPALVDHLPDRPRFDASDAARAPVPNR